MPDVTLRPVEPCECALIFSFLTIAARMEESAEPIQKALVDEQLTKYWKSWGRISDAGVVAIRELDSLPVCCAWLRQLPSDDTGYFEDGILELAFGTVASERGRGVGTRVLTRLIETSRQLVSGISLSVRAANPAVRLYRSFGFETVAEITNRVGTPSLTMLLRFPYTANSPSFVTQ